jgi:UMF1 family MFS transporter
VSFKKVLIVCNIVACIVCAVAYASLKGEGASTWLFVLVFPYSITIGVVFSLSRAVMSCKCIPEGCEAEFFGLFGFFAKCTSYVGPALFVVFNEAFHSMRAGMASLCVFFIAAIGVLLITDLDKAQADAAVYAAELKVTAAAKLKEEEEGALEMSSTGDV